MRKVLGNAAGVLIWKMAAVTVTVILLAGAASAEVIQTFEPNPPDLYDLPHERCYTWGINMPDYSPSFPVTSAQLTFTDIRNWEDSSNRLYVHLLDTAPLGVTSHSDGNGDYFNGQGISLVTYINLPSTAQTLVYDFTSDELAALNSYLSSGLDVGLGFDPDCHFYNSGVSLELRTPTGEIPEPATMGLVGTALVGLIGFIRRRRLV